MDAQVYSQSIYLSFCLDYQQAALEVADNHKIEIMQFDNRG